MGERLTGGHKDAPRPELVTGLILLGYDQPLTTNEIQNYLHTLRNTANTITRTTGGRQPN